MPAGENGTARLPPGHRCERAKRNSRRRSSVPTTRLAVEVPCRDPLWDLETVRTKPIGSCLLVAQLSSGLVLLGLPAEVRAQPRLEGSTEPVGVAIPIAPPDQELMDVGRSATAPAADDVPLDEPLDPDLYVCGAGDSFELRFWGTQNLTVRLTADLEGNAFIPKVGKVRVAGETLTKARALVLRSVRRYYPGLKTDLSLVKPRRFVVHVVGDVRNAGIYHSNARQRMSTIIGEAGGATGLELPRFRGHRALVGRRRNHEGEAPELLTPVSATARRVGAGGVGSGNSGGDFRKFWPPALTLAQRELGRQGRGVWCAWRGRRESPSLASTSKRVVGRFSSRHGRTAPGNGRVTSRSSM